MISLEIKELQKTFKIWFITVGVTLTTRPKVEMQNQNVIRCLKRKDVNGVFRVKVEGVPQLVASIWITIIQLLIEIRVQVSVWTYLLTITISFYTQWQLQIITWDKVVSNNLMNLQVPIMIVSNHHKLRERRRLCSHCLQKSCNERN